MEENKEEIEIELFSTLNEYEIEQICTILTENSIPFVRKDDGSGSYMNLYMGQSVQIKRIFVNKNNYHKSLELISSFLPKEIDDNEEIFEIDEKVEKDEDGKKYLFMRRSLGILILGVPMFLIILVIIMSFIDT